MAHSTAAPEPYQPMDEPKRRSYAVDDVETIARRMKEIAAEREAMLNEPNPLDGERSMAPAMTLQDFQDRIRSFEDYLSGQNPKPDSLEFWQPLIDAGILEVGEA